MEQVAIPLESYSCSVVGRLDWETGWPDQAPYKAIRNGFLLLMELQEMMLDVDINLNNRPLSLVN